ncbi:MAG: galactokinase [Chitinophagales bacterium]|nr:galactokinase [Chitinophagales bacterium]
MSSMESGYPVPVELAPYVNSNSIVVRSPGRINLIGEHLDYNSGFVLPAAIDKAVYVVVEKQDPPFYSLHSVDFNETADIPVADVKPAFGHWYTYILGVVAQFNATGRSVPPFKMAVYGDVPLGAGLSSSAAIESAAAFSINELFGYGSDRLQLVKMAQLAEHEYAGVKCGIMDMFASVFGKKGQVIRLDCRSLEYAYFPLDLQGYEIVLIDTQVKHSLASSEYNVRREQCEAGVAMIQKKYPAVQSLRDATMAMVNECIPQDDIIYLRCKYVVEEIERLVTGCADLERGDVAAFGRKMYRTHEGLSKEYGVSCKELDYLADFVAAHPEVIGARMMGGGFGGCTINIIKKEAVEPLINELLPLYKRDMGLELKYYRVNIEEGTSRI